MVHSPIKDVPGNTSEVFGDLYINTISCVNVDRHCLPGLTCPQKLAWGAY